MYNPFMIVTECTVDDDFDWSEETEGFYPKPVDENEIISEMVTTYHACPTL